MDQVRGADPRQVGSASSPQLHQLSMLSRGIENAIKKHATGSATGAFSGKGQTLGGGPAPSDITGDAKRAVNDATAAASQGFANVDSQVKIFAGLIGLYLVFWYLG